MKMFITKEQLDPNGYITSGFQLDGENITLEFHDEKILDNLRALFVAYDNIVELTGSHESLHNIIIYNPVIITSDDERDEFYSSKLVLSHTGVRLMFDFNGGDDEHIEMNNILESYGYTFK